jgi:hypothetical protein
MEATSQGVIRSVSAGIDLSKGSIRFLTRPLLIRPVKAADPRSVRATK